MKIKYLSYSTVEAFLNCKLGFVKNRELREKLPSATKNSFSEKGNLVHACLEIVFKIKSSKYSPKEILSISSGRKGTGTKLLKGFDEKWIKNNRKLLQTKYKDRTIFFNIAKELALKLAPKFNIGSKFENTKQALEDNLKTLEHAIFSQDRDWFTTEPDKISFVEYELEVTSVFGYPMLMYIDLVLDMGKEIHLIDWKSGNKYWDIRSVENSLQFDFYATGFSIDKNIKKPIKCILDSLKQERPFFVIKDQEQVRFADSFFSNIWDEINDLNPKIAEPTINEYCGFCLFYKNCSAIKIAEKMQIETKTKIKSMSTDQLAENYLNYINIEKFYKYLGYKYKDALQEKILNKEYGKKYTVSSIEVDNYDVEPSLILKHIDIKTAIKKELFSTSISKIKNTFNDKTLKSILDKSKNKSYKKINVSKIKLQSKKKQKVKAR